MLFFGQLIFGQKNFLDQPYLETSGKADTLVIPDKITININLNRSRYQKQNIGRRTRKKNGKCP